MTATLVLHARVLQGPACGISMHYRSLFDDRLRSRLHVDTMW